MVTRWALVGLLALAAVGCSGSENGRYQVIPGQNVGTEAVVVLDTREGRLCFAAFPWPTPEGHVDEDPLLLDFRLTKARSLAKSGRLCTPPDSLPKARP
jgi:hypothetical protein